MKKLTSLLSLIAIGALLPMSVAAQQPTKANATLQGTWQQCSVREVDGAAQMFLKPYLRIIGNDGTYSCVVMRPQGSCFISENGTYQTVSDTIYTATVGYSADSLMRGQKLEVSYHIQGPQWMITQYTVPATGKEVQEIWMKVVPGKMGRMAGGSDRGQGNRQRGARPQQGQRGSRSQQGGGNQQQMPRMQPDMDINTPASFDDDF